ncbi:hypothetical protein [Dyella silvatica]|uniref:hypothetical protein n=1 Tax=Dyella silvatica TaxID=2992128 RepID=UPI00225AA0D9|nr:hypothetical protein [Dyella silvatica]
MSTCQLDINWHNGLIRFMGRSTDGSMASQSRLSNWSWPMAVEGIFLLRELGFVDVSVEKHGSALLHAQDTVTGVLAKRRV